MKNIKHTYSVFTLIAALVLIMTTGCKRDLDELDEATFPTNGEVFIDGFSGGLDYAAFGGSDVTAFDVDKEVKYKGSASMVFSVPDAGDPAGLYAGGVFHDAGGRDLSGYNTLTFYAKASQPTNLDLIGFGNDLGENKYVATVSDLPVNTNWKKYYIPIPDPSKLTQEKGMLFYSVGAKDGKGFTFWLDEVKFENLGTIAHKKPQILNGEDKEEVGVNGATIMVDGLGVSFNLPTTATQFINATAAYFTFESSDEEVASVNDVGLVTVLKEGTSIITAKLGDVDATGSLKVNSTGDFEHAPDPMWEASDVISIFTNKYENVPVEFYNGYWEPWQTTESADFTVEGDDILNYFNFNFVGIQFSTPSVDATAMTHLHIDVYIPNAVNPAAQLAVKIVDLGPDGAFGDPDPSTSMTFNAPPLASQNWVGLDIPLSGLASKDQLAQIILENLASPLTGFYLDNVYFYNDGGTTTTGPDVAAPTPTQDAANVISVFSDSYTNLDGTDFYADWGQSTVVSEVAVQGNNTLVYSGLNYQGIVLGGSTDVSGMEFLHIDYWTDNSTALNAFLISSGDEVAKPLTVPTTGWASVDIPLGDFSPVDLADIIQFKFDGDGNIYLDNIFFYKEGGTSTGPTTAAPAPSHDAADVISVFSDSYSNVDGTDFYPDWGQTTVVSEEMIEGNNTLKYTGLNYQGIVLGSPQDVSGMEFLHIDFWTANSDALNAFLISSEAETPKALSVPTSGWSSIDIPLGDFSPVDLADIIQFKFDGNGDIWLDNLYFYKEGGTATDPTTAAPTPTHNAADVLSIFSDSYTNVAGTDFYADWGQSTVVSEEMIEGNNTLKYAGLNYQGIVLGSSQNISGMEFLHIDFWTANSDALNAFLISSGAETPKALPVPTSGWSSINIPLGDFSPVDLADIIQFKFDGNGDIWLDNIYFYKDGGSPGEWSTDEIIDFETPGFGAAWGWNVFENDSNPPLEFVANPDAFGINTSSTVAKITALQSGQPWVGCETQHGEIGFYNIDASNSTIKIMVYKTVISDVGIKLVKPDGWAMAEIKVSNTVVNAWEELTFDFSSQMESGYDQIVIFPDFDLDGRTQDNVVYFDNITFHEGGGTATEPTAAAPTPSHATGDVISVFSDSYTNVAGTDFYPDWGQTTVVSEEMIEGNNTLKYAGLNYQGVVLGSSLDVSGMDYLHIDFWTANSDAFNAFLISSGSETAKTLSVPTSGWSSINIPLGDFSPVDLADVIQFKFDGNGDIWLDNIYFYKDGGSPGEWSTDEVMDFETPGFGAGWGWNVFENDSNPPLEFVANPDASGANTSATVAKITALQAGQPWVGCETQHGEIGIYNIDASNSTIKIMVYKTVISDVGIKLVKPDGWSMGELKVANTVVNAWEELTFDFSSQMESGYDQIVIFPDFDLAGRTQDNVVYFDNIRFSAN